MKKLFLLLFLLSCALYAQNSSYIKEVAYLKTASVDEYNLTTIKTVSDEFITPKEEFLDNHHTYWVKVTLQPDTPKGDYIISYGDMGFDLSTIEESQHPVKYTLNGIKRLKLYYDPSIHADTYYLRLTPSIYEKPVGFIEMLTLEAYNEAIDKGVWILIFTGLMLGIVLMTAIYNFGIYYFNRQIAFLYYGLMQLSIIVVVFNTLNIIQFSQLPIARNDLYYGLTELIAAIFATLFTREFLTTKGTCKWCDLFLRGYLYLLLAYSALAIVYPPIIDDAMPFSIFLMIFLLIAYKRYRQGHKAALFYLIGWGAMIFSIAMIEFFEQTLIFNLMVIGSPIEAVFLALALAYNMNLLRKEQETQQKLLIQQSKLASMGEMIGNIAHQWRQPLTHLSYIFMNIQEAYKDKSLDKVYLDKKVTEATKQLEYLSTTIDDFHHFYKPESPKERFSLCNETQSALEIIKGTLEKENITCTISCIKDADFESYKNQYIQVILVLLNNAKEALLINNIKDASIEIVINNLVVEIADNAGGIKDSYLEKVFEPYFSTKEDSSGIGLYMANMIVEKNLGGKLEVKNGSQGAIFTISLQV